MWNVLVDRPPLVAGSPFELIRSTHRSRLTATFAFPVAGCRGEGFRQHGARMASPLNELVPPGYRKRSVARPSVHWSSCSGSLPQHGRLIPITG